MCMRPPASIPRIVSFSFCRPRSAVVHQRLLGVGLLESRACAQVREVHGHRVAAAGPDDGPVGDVSVHPLSVERALGHVEERDVGVLLVLRAAAVRAVAQPAVSVGVADAVEGRADRVRDADGLREVFFRKSKSQIIMKKRQR